MRRFFSGLRFRLVLLVLLAALPALGLTLYNGLQQRRNAIQTAGQEALHLTRLVVSQNNAYIEGAHQLLIAVAQLPTIQNNDTASCNQFLQSLLKQYPLYTFIGAFHTDGNLYCSSNPETVKLNVSDRDYFKIAIATKNFATGDFTIGRVTGRSVLPFAYPILDANGNVTAVVNASIDLAWIDQIGPQVQLPSGAVILAVDHTGKVLARYPASENWVGKTLPEAPIIREIIKSQGEGTVQTKGLDGIERLYAFTPLAGGAVAGAYVSIGLPVSLAYAPVNQSLSFSMLLLGIVTLLALVAAWFIGDWLVLKPVHKLADATHRLREGDLSSRVADYYGSDELSHLAKNFNQMAGALEKQNTRLREEIAARQQAEAALHDYSIQLERSNRELQDFAYIASHDLQEPLRKIQAFGERLANKYKETLGEEGCNYIERMNSSAARMQTLINDLLTYSRVTSKAQPFSPVDLNQVASDVIVDLEERIAQTNGKIEVSPLPTIEADPLQMRQLLQNLAGNALKFHKVDVPPVVHIYAAQSTDNQIEIRVSDNGIGFQEKYLDRIFQPFQRLHTRGEYEGSGMGLAICRKIVERHEGRITAQSSPDYGTTFIVVLPIKQRPKGEPS